MKLFVGVIMVTIIIVFILGNPNISYQKEFDCRNDLVSIIKHNGKQYCVKPTSFYPLLDRGWASHLDNDAGVMSLEVAKKFITSDSLRVIEFSQLEITDVSVGYPEQYLIFARYLISQPAIDWIVPEKETMILIISNGEILVTNINNSLDEPSEESKGYVLDELIIEFKDGISESELLDIVSSCNTKIKSSIIDYTYALTIIREGQTVYETMNCFNRNHEFYVVNVQPNFIYHLD